MLYGKRITFKRNKDYPGVVLTTAHSSKGLEWPVVFNSITKYDSELLHGNSKHLNRAAMVEEKRRLFFVSATRARDELIVTGEYVAFGKKDDRTYNQFLKEAYDAMGLAYNPVDPMEDVKKAEQKERAKIKAKERRECKKQELIKKTMKNVKDAIAVAEMGKSSLTESNN